METVDRSDAPCPTEARVLHMLDRIGDAAESYESSVDHEPVTDDEVRRYREERPR